jgi:hypothetical protein
MLDRAERPTRETRTLRDPHCREPPPQAGQLNILAEFFEPPLQRGHDEDGFWHNMNYYAQFLLYLSIMVHVSRSLLIIIRRQSAPPPQTR